MSKTLYEAATVLRSKNSGPFAITLDVLFNDEATYRLVKERQLLSRETIARLYHLEEEQVASPVYFDNALGIKVTFSRTISSGSALDTDVYGAQQHAPLMGLPLPEL